MEIEMKTCQNCDKMKITEQFNDSNKRNYKISFMHLFSRWQKFISCKALTYNLYFLFYERIKLNYILILKITHFYLSPAY